MSLPEVASSRSSPVPEACPECDATASVASDLHKYQTACTCKPARAPARPADTPPALPPRPAHTQVARRSTTATNWTGNAACRRRKYAWWCVGSGALCAALGGLLAAQHILLRAYTASPRHLETVPAAVPAAMLVLTGVCIMSLARRRNRYSYMIKVVGACCLVCALTCVLVTITTTVIHMNKLQTLKYCDYTVRTRTCTCFSHPLDAQHANNDDEGVRCVFEGVSGCGVVHGALYWCLRGVFALSVSAVLVCIFSCMLAYQLLSHERKKMYWEQLEMRCRSLYRPPETQSVPAPRPQQVTPVVTGRLVPVTTAGVHSGSRQATTQTSCSCCAQCHPAQPAWDISLQHRFWAPGRIGNLYSPNPGTTRKTSAWSWFPWPRSNSQNSRCRMNGVPQSGDSAYGFCETETANNPVQYDQTYPANFNQTFQRNYQGGNFQGTGFQGGSFQGANFQGPANFQGSGTFQGNFPVPQGYPEGYEGGSYDAQTGVWGPPPPYSPQGRSGSRHHLHQDPATATLLHHHHIEVHRNSMPIHDHPIQTHTCRNSYIVHNLPTNLEHPEADLRMSERNERPERNERIAERIDLPRFERYQEDLRTDMHLPEGRFNTLRGHLVPYRSCQRNLGMSAGNIHRDCRIDDSLAIESLHQKSASKVSDHSSDSCQKQGKENLGFQNDKHSPIRASMQDCHRGHHNAESEVYFADVSSCCNVSVKTDCCMKPNVSALVGTIENHPESTSESDTGSFTLTRQQRPQPQVGSKRRPRQTDKHKNEKLRDINSSLRLEQLNNSIREQRERMSNSKDRLNDSRIDRMNETRVSERLNESRISERNNDLRLSDRLNESRMNERNESRNDSRGERIHECRLNDSRVSERMNDSRLNETRLSDRVNNSRLDELRISDRINNSRLDETCISERINDSRLNETRLSDRMNETRISDRMNETRISDLINESRVSDRVNETRISDRTNDSRLNESRISDRMSESRVSERLTDSRIEDRRMSDVNSSFKDHKSPIRKPKDFKTESPKPEFFAPPPPTHSPLSPNTEETLLSEDEERTEETVYSNEPESSNCKTLGPDSQYETVNEGKEVIKGNHHHCYSDTNTMDSGWQSGSEKQVTD